MAGHIKRVHVTLQRIILVTFVIAMNFEAGSSALCPLPPLNTSVNLCPTSRPLNASECESLVECCWDSNTTSCYQTANFSTQRPPVTTSRQTQTTSTSKQQRGYCVKYNKPTCTSYLNHSESLNTTRFIDGQMGIEKTEAILVQFFGVIDKHVENQNTNCHHLLKAIVCQFLLPKCDQYGVPKNYCREDCDAIFKKCNVEVKQLLAIIKYMIQNGNIDDFVHLVIPNCTQFKYSYESDGKCEHFGLFDFQASTTPKPKSALVVPIIAGSVGLIVFIIMIIIIIIVIKRHKLKSQCDYKGVTFTAVTMRDRLRADTIMALDEMKVMSLYNPDDLIQYPLDKVEYVKDLGEGNFGQVFQGRAFALRPLDKPGVELMVAVKTLKSGCSKEMKVAFLKEVTMMSVLHHENIVELLAVSTEEEPYGMIFEFMSNGDLSQYLRSRGPYALDESQTKKDEIPTKEELLSISLQVANGMEYLQTMRLVHRDLATRNCLVGDDLTVKIADFGMSRDVYASDYYKVEGQAVMPIRWMPPEALLFGKFTVESDVYSFGVLLWEVYTYALQPYYGYTNEEVVDFVKKGVHLGKPDDCENFIYDIMKYCWNKDPSQRPNFQKIKALLKQEDDSPYDLPDEPTIANPLYEDKMDLEKGAQAQAEAQAAKSSPTIKRQTDKTPADPSPGYMNIAYQDGKEVAAVKLEEGEQEI